MAGTRSFIVQASMACAWPVISVETTMASAWPAIFVQAAMASIWPAAVVGEGAVGVTAIYVEAALNLSDRGVARSQEGASGVYYQDPDG